MDGLKWAGKCLLPPVPRWAERKGSKIQDPAVHGHLPARAMDQTKSPVTTGESLPLSLVGFGSGLGSRGARRLRREPVCTRIPARLCRCQELWGVEGSWDITSTEPVCSWSVCIHNNSQCPSWGAAPRLLGGVGVIWMCVSQLSIVGA